jgi:hypothetical protein
MPNVSDRGIVVGALGTAFVVQSWRSLRRGDIPPARSYIGLVVAAVILAGVGTFSPDLAKGFAILVLVAVLLNVTQPTRLRPKGG